MGLLTPVPRRSLFACTARQIQRRLACRILDRFTGIPAYSSYSASMITKPPQKNMPSKMTKADPLKAVQVYLPEPLWRQVRALALSKGIQARELVSIALHDYLKKQKVA